MAIDYNRMAKIATKLLQPPPKGNGTVIQLLRAVPGAYNSETGLISGASNKVLSTVGIWLARSADYQITGRGVGGVVKTSNVESQDRELLIDGSVAPQLDDKVMFEGQAWQVLGKPRIIKPTVVAIAYILVMRK